MAGIQGLCYEMMLAMILPSGDQPVVSLSELVPRGTLVIPAELSGEPGPLTLATTAESPDQLPLPRGSHPFMKPVPVMGLPVEKGEVRRGAVALSARVR